ncbi:hypothetical protein QUB80_18425 [Chlorogloeopsis sp. ULAP01]|uniref:hypothetical protein n=1 Tax=Chlorogloeopsis sp. ULAP01 TaxID=3056483 RepID=UPI0025AA9333|nr:hypothetical protein [Chlorogloeopsis sp. ULAP01]MDM9382674.1 hypothetical protein [Chlorogloeopsis sp. ULAP01]
MQSQHGFLQLDSSSFRQCLNAGRGDRINLVSSIKGVIGVKIVWEAEWICL